MAEIKSQDTVRDKYQASVVLSAVGDAIGFKSGNWEFTKSGTAIHEDAEQLGGVMKLEVEPDNFPVSDDTVMHIATIKALISDWDQDKADTKEKQLQKLYKKICDEYVICWDDMGGRSPGIQCGAAMPYLEKGRWENVPYSNGGGGCGAAMRTMAIGLYFYKPEQVEDLIRISIESSRMTHTHPTGFLGGVVAALFTAYAMQNIPTYQWGHLFMKDVLDKCVDYCKESKRDMDKYTQNNAFDYFKKAWSSYLESRGLTDGDKEPTFPQAYGVVERDKFYKSISFSGWGGSSGHDSVIIAYDALLGAKGDWKEFCDRGILHGGDNDSTAAIGAAWYGVLYGFKGVPTNHVERLEKKAELESLADKLFNKSYAVDVSLNEHRD